VNATSILTNATIGLQPTGLFVDGVNSLFVSSSTHPMISIRPQGYTIISRNITGAFNQSLSHFVALNGDVFIDNGALQRRVDRWIYNESRMIVAMQVNGSCHGLFWDLNDTLYCSMGNFHQVWKLFANNSPNQTLVAAGTGQAGLSSTMLDRPRGIYVDTDINLYVADCGNNRVERFAANQLTAITLVGNGSSNTISLRCPTSIALDADRYLFIVDSLNHRIVGSGPYGYRCIAGCLGTNGSALNELSFPQQLAFNSYGDLFVSDRNNHRILQFELQKTTCGK
jgi:DNA-binding beta-propeller fold protein YncE